MDVVIGTHPHVVQDYEILTKGDHNMYVYYSLGNFVSGQDKPGTTEGAMAQFIIKKDSSGKTYISSFDMKIQSFFVVKK